MVSGSLLLVIFVVSIALLLFSIIKLNLNPFLALLCTAIITGLMVQMPLVQITAELANGFGGTLKGVGIVIGLGVIFGQLLAEARATDAIANAMLRSVGKNNAALAINTSGWVVSIPVFLDAAFVIFMPLVRHIAKTIRKPILVLVCALGVGSITSHALVIPTPGPVAVAGNMQVNIGIFLLYSLIVSLPASLAGGYLYGKYLETTPAGRRSLAESELLVQDDFVPEAESNNPSAGLSLSILLLPIMLILVGSIISLIIGKTHALYPLVTFLGDKNIALLIGVISAMVFLRPYFTRSASDMITEACASAGMIFLITGAGGSFGQIITASGIGHFLVEALKSMNISLLVLGFILSQMLRSAQGSTTVALITTSSILGPLVAGTGLSPVLVGLAICAGGIGGSLPNDSGFWVISRYSGLSVPDTLRAWTMGGTISGCTAFVLVYILSKIPGLPGLY